MFPLGRNSRYARSRVQWVCSTGFKWHRPGQRRTAPLESPRTRRHRRRNRESVAATSQVLVVKVIRQGLNTKKGFDVKVAAEISKITGLEFRTAPNKVNEPKARHSLTHHGLFFSSSRLLPHMMLWSRLMVP
jgi:Fumarase